MQETEGDLIGLLSKEKANDFLTASRNKDQRDVCLKIEKDLLKSLVPSFQLIACINNTVTISIHRTIFTRFSLQITILESYPSHIGGFHVDITSSTMPVKLLNKLKQLALSKLETHLESDYASSLGTQAEEVFLTPILFLYVYLTDIVLSNKLLYATPEINQVRTKVKPLENCSLSLNERKGLIYLSLVLKQYTIKIKVTVPENYPMHPLSFKVIKSNLPHQISDSYILAAAEKSRTLATGGGKVDLIAKQLERNLSKISTSYDSKLPVHLTKDYVNSLKEDVNVLKKLTDLEKVDKSYNKQLHKFEYDKYTRKESRREKRKLTKSELLKEKRNLEERKKHILAEQESKLKSTKGPERSLKACLLFLIDDFWFTLTKIVCPTTNEKVFDFRLSPQEMEALFQRRNKSLPVRVNCGCWFKYHELNKFLTEPPFGRECPNKSCNKVRVFHKDWPTNIKHLEKQYAMKMAREREINEVAEFFQLDESFIKSN